MFYIDLNLGAKKTIIKAKKKERLKGKEIFLPGVGTAIKFLFPNDEVKIIFKRNSSVEEIVDIDIEPPELEQLEKIKRKGTFYLAYAIENSDNKTEIILTIKEFVNKEVNNISVYLDDNYKNILMKETNAKDLNTLGKRLENKFTYVSIEESYFLLAFPKSHTKNPEIRLCGYNFYIALSEVEDKYGRKYFKAIKKPNGKIKEDNYKFYLYQGNLKFKDENDAEKESISEAVKQKYENAETYISKWIKYLEQSLEILYKKFYEIGAISIDSYKLQGDKIYLYINPNSKENLIKLEIESKKDVMLSLSDNNPCDRAVPLVDFEEEMNKVSGFDFNISEVETEKNAVILKLDRNQQNGYSNSNISSFKFAFLSVRGSLNSHKVRSEAVNRILNGESLMPNLLDVLQGESSLGRESAKNRKKLQALTPLVIEKVFPKNPPTLNQEKAIEIGLNTPDIAIIQGPPGTGKTTVINAILERLNEERGLSEGIAGSDLITAFQHDAVTNAVERIKVLGLPTPKFGKKSSEKDNEDLIFSERIEWWRNRQAIKLKEKYNLKAGNDTTEIQRIFEIYINSSVSIENTLQILGKVKRIFSHELRDDLLERLQQEIFRLKNFTEKYIDEEFIRMVRKIPRNEVEYGENGRRELRRIFKAIESDNETLYKTFEMEIENVDKRNPDFESVTVLRKKLLLELLPKRQIFDTKQKNTEVQDLLRDILEWQKEEYEMNSNSEEKVILDFYRELSDNPRRVESTIKKYTVVHGVTNQQLVSNRELKDAKEISKYELPVYENILGDEAARSTPLDLLIPMSLAENRIILVGDHRQLPHMIEEEILKKIDREENDGKSYEQIEKAVIEKEVSEGRKYTGEDFKVSLFQYLFEKAKELEEKDGIQRRITLDKQYRTHPTLGNYISENFYTCHGEELENGLNDKSLFYQYLDGIEKKAAVWIDVPRDDEEGKEERDHNKSWYRVSEAKIIANDIKKKLSSEEGHKRSFGIITFYRAQVEQIEKELLKPEVGVYGQDSNNNYYLKDEFMTDFNKTKEEKLRVGTVDAFQGMEFDVVYLSMVRTNDRKNYGHLKSPNRLCVSMSRQKKVLIVVGDSQMVSSESAKREVLELYNFYNLCKENKEDGKIISHRDK
jgi:hypothetical protein